MKYFQRMPIEQYVFLLVSEDRDILKTIDGWNVERSVVSQILINHFLEYGIFAVDPLEHAELINENIMFQLKNSLEIKAAIRKVEQEIERQKSKHARR